MRIGIDLDNTIVCYDGVFHRVALELGLIPPHTATDKTAVRDALRSDGREEAWTELQGRVYGDRMTAARLYPGVLEFLQACRSKGRQVFVVSHRTQQPYVGVASDLHDAALAWLERNGVFEKTGLSRASVYLEPTKQGKLARIALLTCSHFIDDLPEFLGEPAFPKDVARVLFDPHARHPRAPFTRVASWRELSELLG
jgi:hypothetical protein